MPEYVYIKNQLYYVISSEKAQVNAKTLDWYYNQALECYNNNDLLGSISNLKNVVTMNVHYKDANERLAYYMRELEGIKANEVLLREQLRQNLDDAEIRFDLADTLYVLGKTAEALSFWKELSNQSAGYWGKRARKMLERHGTRTNVNTALQVTDDELAQSITTTPRPKLVKYCPGNTYSRPLFACA